MAGGGGDSCRRGRRSFSFCIPGEKQQPVCGPCNVKLQGWAAELPGALLHSIVDLLGSFPDFLAFASICHPWYAAFSSSVQIHIVNTLPTSPPSTRCPFMLSSSSHLAIASYLNVLAILLI